MDPSHNRKFDKSAQSEPLHTPGTGVMHLSSSAEPLSGLATPKTSPQPASTGFNLEAFEKVQDVLKAGELYYSVSQTLRQIRRSAEAFDPSSTMKAISRLTHCASERIAEAFDRAVERVIGEGGAGVPMVDRSSLQDLRTSATTFLNKERHAGGVIARQLALQQRKEWVGLSPLTILAISGAVSVAGLSAASSAFAAGVGVGVLGAGVFVNRLLYNQTIAQHGFRLEVVDAWDHIVGGSINPLDESLRSLFSAELETLDTASVGRANAMLIARALRVLGVPHNRIAEAFQAAGSLPIHISPPMALLRAALVKATANERGDPLRPPDLLIDLYCSPRLLQNPEMAAFKEFLEQMNYVYFATAVWGADNLRREFTQELLKL